MIVEWHLIKVLTLGFIFGYMFRQWSTKKSRVYQINGVKPNGFLNIKEVI